MERIIRYTALCLAVFLLAAVLPARAGGEALPGQKEGDACIRAAESLPAGKYLSEALWSEREDRQTPRILGAARLFLCPLPLLPCSLWDVLKRVFSQYLRLELFLLPLFLGWITVRHRQDGKKKISAFCI